jgi:hypothetical protein
LHQKKVGATVRWSQAGVIHRNFLNPGETIVVDRYCWEIAKMHRKLREKHAALANLVGAILVHDVARQHVSHRTLQKLNEISYETLPDPPSSSDLSPTHCHFSKHLNNFLQEKISNNQAEAEGALIECAGSSTSDYYQCGKMKLFLVGKIIFILMGFYFR